MAEKIFTPQGQGPNPKWTEVEHLPKWDEEFYHVYTARKHGKWVMLKTLRPEFRDTELGREMIRKEFDARYDLSHPNIVMINDFEDVPEVGFSIICDDVYGTSLRELIDQKKVTEAHIEQLRNRLPSALQYIHEKHLAHHPIRPETIIFTQDVDNLKLIDVGFEQRPHLTPADASQDVAACGRIILEALDALPDGGKRHPQMQHIAERCAKATPRHNPYPNIPKLQMALNHQKHDMLYLVIIAFLLVMVGWLAWVAHQTKNTQPVKVYPEVEQSAPAPENGLQH